MHREQKSLRTLIAKIGLDGHEIGMKVVSSFLREIGVEVVYLGPYQTPESVVNSAIQEDVDVIGLSFLGGDHLESPGWTGDCIQARSRLEASLSSSASGPAGGPPGRRQAGPAFHPFRSENGSRRAMALGLECGFREGSRRSASLHARSAL